MTLTFHLAASAEQADAKIAVLAHEVEWAWDAEKKAYDRAKLIQSLGNDLINIGSDDSTNCLVIGAMILQEFHDNMLRMERVSSKAYDRSKDLLTLHGAERNLHKGRVAYVRARITDVADGGVKCRVSYANPKGVPGTCLEFAHDVAVYLVQIADAIANEYAKVGSPIRPFVTDHDDCPGLVNEARLDYEHRVEAQKIRWLNERRLKCKCRLSTGHCSPCHPKCRFFERGMCVDVKPAI